MTEEGLFTVCSLFHKPKAFSLDSIRVFLPFPEIAHSIINLLIARFPSRYLNNAFLFTESFFSFNVIHNKKSQSALFVGVLTSKIDKKLSFLRNWLFPSAVPRGKRAVIIATERGRARSTLPRPNIRSTCPIIACHVPTRESIKHTSDLHFELPVLDFSCDMFQHPQRKLQLKKNISVKV